MYRSKPSEFQMAIEEAVLAENGFVYPPCKATDSEANVTEIQEATDFYQDQAYHSQNQASFFFSFLSQYDFFYIIRNF